jgi:hypothetical protein
LTDSRSMGRRYLRHRQPLLPHLSHSRGVLAGRCGYVPTGTVQPPERRKPLVWSAHPRRQA